MFTEPAGCLFGHLLQSARFLEQMGRPGNDAQLFRTDQLLMGLLIEFDNHIIETTYQ